MPKINKQWTNLGDVTFMEHGGFFVKEDAVEGHYNVVKIDKYEDSDCKYAVQTGYVGLEDRWINWSQVMSFTDLQKEDKPERAVQALFEFYGYTEFEGTLDIYLVEGHAEDALKELGVIEK